jgi:hypothetical protein
VQSDNRSSYSVEDTVSKRNVDLMSERKVVNCVDFELEKSVGSKYSVKSKREQPVNDVLSYS